MKFIKGESRNQVQLFCLEQAVDKDNEVRLIDLFINSLALKDYGFRTEFEENGRPAYHPADLLRLFIYGYLNRIRSMGAMVRRAKTILGHNNFTGLYDKGYHTGTEFDYANKHGVEVIVAFPEVASHAPDLAFDVEHFDYNKDLDQYICPAKQTLTTNGRWYNKASGKTMNRMKHYKTKACLSCPLFDRCTTNKKGRLIERSEHQNLIDTNKQRHNQNQSIYRKRQAIVEHPFGVIKRQWDFYYIMTKKSIKHAQADVGMIFTAYNLRRIFNLIDKNLLQSYLKELGALFFELKHLLKGILRLFKTPEFSRESNPVFLSLKIKSL
jgi:hypothetical protein